MDGQGLTAVTDPILSRLRTLAVARFGEPATRLGDDDDLFEGLGIDSLGALDLLSRLEEAFGVEVPDYEMQGVHTLAGLAALVKRRAR